MTTQPGSISGACRVGRFVSRPHEPGQPYPQERLGFRLPAVAGRGGERGPPAASASAMIAFVVSHTSAAT